MELPESSAGGFEVKQDKIAQKIAKEKNLSDEYGAGSFSYSAKKDRKHMAVCMADVVEEDI